MKKLAQSFAWAFLGIWRALSYERNFRLMWSSGIMVLLLNGIFSFSQTESFSLLAAVLLVLSVELFNTSLEKLCDLYSQKPNSLIKNIKDAAAGAVLFISFFSLSLFFYIFYNNFNMLWPWFFSFASVDFILFFMFIIHQALRGKSSVLDAISSFITLIFMAKEFNNYLWALAGIIAFLIWQTALIINTVDIYALKARLRKIIPSL